MPRAISQATIYIQIDDYRHDGGYDLVLQFDGTIYSIKDNFDKNEIIVSDFKFKKKSLKIFEDLMQKALVYSNEQDKWACKWVSIRNSDIGLEWTSETNREPRNNDSAGPNDNPITFTNFFAQATNSNTWMQSYAKSHGDKKLGQICILGAHDAGMSELHGHTIVSYPCNTITQNQSIGGLLELGVRYFDIRPVWTGETFRCGHYSDTHDPAAGIQGGNGVSLVDLVNDINEFTKGKSELVILNLSHDFDTTQRAQHHNTYPPLNQEQYDQIFAELNKLTYLYKTQVVDLTDITLKAYIGSGHSSVIVIVDPSDSGVAIPGSLLNNGFYEPSRYNVINIYSNTNNLAKMAEDQIGKMNQYKDSYFLLSWTLTQDLDDAECFTKEHGGSILESARAANEQIETYLEPSCSKAVYPKIIYMDCIEDDLPCTLCEFINYDVIGS